MGDDGAVDRRFVGAACCVFKADSFSEIFADGNIFEPIVAPGQKQLVSMALC